MVATEVLIVGGGPAGIAAALGLTRAGHAACVVEQSQYRDARIGEHLSPECRPVLEQLGLWPCVAAGGHLPSPGIRAVWNSDAPYERDYVFGPYGAGYNLNRRRFDASLARAASSAGVKLITGARVANLEAVPGGWCAQLGGAHSDTAIAARFLVDATGRSASMSRRIGAHRAGADRLIALGAWLEDDAADTPDPWLCVESISHGWWYAAALPGSRLAAVLLTDRDLASSGLAGAQQFWNACQSGTCAIAPMLRRYRRPIAFRIAAAHSFRLDPAAGANWLAVGDAAMAVDPLASMGILMALRSGLAAAETIAAHFQGDGAALERHSRDVTQRFEKYLGERAAVYALERRWPDEPFWRRRRTDAISSLP